MPQTAVATGAAHWDIGGYRIWESTEPGILLYARNELRLAADSNGRPFVAFSRALGWNGTDFVPTGGSATLGFLGTETDDPARLLSLQDEWTRVVRASEGHTAQDPRYLPLPIRDATLSARLDPADAASTAEGSTLRVDLTAAGAKTWAAAITEGAPVAGTVRLSYAYLQVMPPATAVVQVHGRQLYAELAARLAKAPDGELSGSMAQIRSAWTDLASTGALEVSLTGSPAGPLADARDALVEQVRENLFDTMFVPRPALASEPSMFALRWKRAADMPELPLTVSVEGPTWLTETVEASVGKLLSHLSPDMINDVHPAVSVGIDVLVCSSDLVESAGVSLDFGDIRAPETITFDRAGGSRMFIVTTARPDRLMVRHRTRIVFQTSSWPVLTVEGTASAAAPHVQVVPDNWVRRCEIFVFVVQGGKAAWGENDALTANVRYESPALTGPIASSAGIRPDAPVRVDFPAPPGTPPGRCAISVFGSVGGKLIQSSGDLGPTDAFAVFVLEDGATRFITDSTPMPESDPVGQRLRAAGGRPLVRREIPPDAEANRRPAVSVDVALVPQPTTVSGWAAAMAMVAGGRDKAAITPAIVAARAGMNLEESYGWPQIRAAVKTLALIEQVWRGSSPGELAALLREWGPVWMVDPAAPYRGVVVGGITGDGTWVRVNDPWPPGVGAVRHKTFIEFHREFSGTAMVHG